MPQTPKRDLFQILLVVVLLAGLIALSFYVLGPFMPAIVWASMIVISTWRLLLAVQKRLWGKRWAAVLVLTVVQLLILVIPLSLAVGSIVSNVDDITGWVRSLENVSLAAPPDWVHGLPFVGEKLDAAWREAALDGDLPKRIAPYAGEVVKWAVGQLGSLGSLLIHFLLTVTISAIFYANGEATAAGIRRFTRRIGGDKGVDALHLAAAAIRSVAQGVVVTAFAQAVMGGIGIAIAGVPFATVLTAIMFLLAVAQIGAAPVLIGCTIWLFWSGATGWGTAMVVWTILVSAMDNVLRPMLIRRGANLPLILIFAGVIGGLITFGVIGLFIGPMVLAVTYTLLSAWVVAGTEPEVD